MESQIRTVNDMLQALEQDIADLKNGTLPESQARVIARIRGHELRLAELALRYKRLLRAGERGNEYLLLPSLDGDAAAKS